MILAEMGKAMKSMNVKDLFFTYSQLLSETFTSSYKLTSKYVVRISVKEIINHKV